MCVVSGSGPFSLFTVEIPKTDTFSSILFSHHYDGSQNMLCTPCLINTNYNKDSASSVYFLEENCRYVLNFTVLTSDFLISEHYALVALHFIWEVPILNEHRFFKYVFSANGVKCSTLHN